MVFQVAEPTLSPEVANLFLEMLQHSLAAGADFGFVRCLDRQRDLVYPQKLIGGVLIQ